MMRRGHRVERQAADKRRRTRPVTYSCSKSRSTEYLLYLLEEPPSGEWLFQEGVACLEDGLGGGGRRNRVARTGEMVD